MMQPQHCTREALTIVGLPLRTELAHAVEEVGPHWHRFNAEGWVDRIPYRVDNRLYGLYTDYSGDYTEPFTLIVGVAVSQVDELPAELVIQEFVAGDYARFDVNGPLPDAITAAWVSVWQSPLERAYQTDLEIYSDEGAELLIGFQS